MLWIGWRWKRLVTESYKCWWKKQHFMAESSVCGLTWSSSLWICSLISWMSESIIFPPWNSGAAKTSSFTGPLKSTHGHHWARSKQNITFLYWREVTSNQKNTQGTLTFGLCACQWQRTPYDSRGWQSWTSCCPRWCTRRFLRRNGSRSDRTAVLHTAELLAKES